MKPRDLKKGQIIKCGELRAKILHHTYRADSSVIAALQDYPEGTHIELTEGALCIWDVVEPTIVEQYPVGTELYVKLKAVVLPKYLKDGDKLNVSLPDIHIKAEITKDYIIKP
jgi:hypothetical protein